MRLSGYAGIVAGLAVYVGARLVERAGVTLDPLVGSALSVVAVLLVAVGGYRLLTAVVVSRTESKRRAHDARSVLRLAVGLTTAVTIFGVLTRNWVSVLFSLGVLGFAATFALQQPLFSLAGWLYVILKRPYQVGDRIAIEDTRGDVVSIDLFVTRVWEIDGDLVSSNQPSGRIVTIPNSTVLSARVVNFYGEGVEAVWNELSVQVAYETDLAFASEQMIEVAREELGEEMARQTDAYRRRLAETPVELDVNDQPTVNVVQRESWVELRLRYIVHPRRGTRVRNALYEEVLSRFNDHPDRVKFPVSRNR